MKDLFVENLDAVKYVAYKLAKESSFIYNVDELVNAAYISYDKAITNNPSLVEGVFSKLGCFFFRVKSDMKDYILKQSNFRMKKYTEEKGKRYKTVPEILPFPVKKDEDGVWGECELSCTEHGYKEVETEDYLDELFMRVELTPDEWHIIQGYFYDEMTMKEIGEEINLTESRISQKKRIIEKKLLACANEMR